ncbi:hypothetical protein GCM10012275_29920 [Longimycelium tulufanense]|uniref:Secreted protein n=1 Tax=Longimycelium tulufanense TaxID=907463 RepID=A0A8J3CEH8_9PSEU|nr:hypothetical protein GCM10012275_29920 [Longimycelium tulufanense]
MRVVLLAVLLMGHLLSCLAAVPDPGVATGARPLAASVTADIDCHGRHLPDRQGHAHTGCDVVRTASSEVSAPLPGPGAESFVVSAESGVPGSVRAASDEKKPAKKRPQCVLCVWRN